MTDIDKAIRWAFARVAGESGEPEQAMCRRCNRLRPQTRSRVGAQQMRELAAQQLINLPTTNPTPHQAIRAAVAVLRGESGQPGGYYA